MKKFVGITIALLLLVACIVPACAFAAGETTEGVIYLLNPTAIAIVGNRMYVADNIEQGKSAILSFDVSGNKPAFKYSWDLEGNVVNLSAKGDDGLYAVFSDKVVEYSVGEDLTAVTTFNVKNAVNFIQGVDGEENTEYYASAEHLYSNKSNAFWEVTVGTLNNIKDILFIGDNFYYLHGNEGASKCQRWNGKQHASSPTDVINTKLDISGYDARGLFVWTTATDSFPAFFSDNEVCYVEIANESCSVVPLLTHDGEANGTINDIAAAKETLYVLNSQHKIEIYKKNSISGKYESTTTIGTETLPGEVPTQYTSFTLVESVGYPSNIIFKTEGARSVENLVENATQYIVLGYEGDETSDFYYILFGDSFGWVRKNGETSVESDSKLRVIDTTVGNGSVTYTTKFVSLNAVYLAPLPRESFLTEDYWTAYSQSASNRTQVTALQRFTEGETVWYYVRYDTDKYGFVKEQDLGNFHLSADLSDVTVVGQKKINATLFGTVYIYDNGEPETMTEDHLATDEKGDVVKLRSGQRVTVIDEFDNGTSLVQIAFGDGTNATGYVLTERLINVNALTTNAVFGLVAVCIALTLTIALTVVFVRRRKNRSKTEEKPDKPEEK